MTADRVLWKRTVIIGALVVAATGCGSSSTARPRAADADVSAPAPPNPDAGSPPADRSVGPATAPSKPDRPRDAAAMDDSGAPDAVAADAGPTISFEPAPCGFAAPTGRAVTCGFITVPEDRTRPAGHTVRLFVARLPAKTPKAGVPPLLYVDGGPGIAGTQSVSGSFGAPGGGDFVALAIDRDVVFFDARGTGASTPALSCPPAADGTASEQQVTQACWKDLTGMGIPLDQYDTLAAADDVDDIRQALGERQIDLLGVSYGTRVVLEVLRRHPSRVHAAVVDSVLPPEVDLLAQTEPAGYRALKLAFDGCAADAACRKSYPALDTVLVGVLRQLATRPPTLTLSDGKKVPLDDQTFMQFVTERLMDPLGVAGIPELVFQTRDQKYTLITQDLDGDEPPPGAAPEPNYDGVYNTVICADEAPFTSAAAIAAAAAAIPTALRPYFVEGRLELCADWKVASAPASANQPVMSDVPTLFLSGSIDPVTPPAWAQAAAAAMAHGHFVLLPGLSHGTMGNPCARSIIFDFLGNPGAAPAAACARTLPPVKFHIAR